MIIRNVAIAVSVNVVMKIVVITTVVIPIALVTLIVVSAINCYD